MVAPDDAAAAGKPRLPYKQLIILSLARFAEPISFAGVLPYLPSYIENLDVAKNDIAKWAGAAVFLFSAAQCCTAIAWGRLSDRIGRKPVILTCLFLTALFTMAWGFSTSLPVALLSRAMLGACNGNVGILRTVVAEMVPWRELQPMAFAIMPTLFNVGSVVGPAVSGLLANPYGVEPGQPHGNRLLEVFPFALPNIVAATSFAISFVAIFFGLSETLAARKDRPDVGRKACDWAVRVYGRVVEAVRAAKGKRKINLGGDEMAERTPVDQEEEPFLGRSNSFALDEETARQEGLYRKSIEDAKPPPWKDVFTLQSCYCVMAYASLALHSGCYDMLLPVFMHHPLREPESLWKFAGGFGVGPRNIGLMYTLYGIITALAQVFIYPWITRKVGVLRCFRITSIVYIIAYILTPFCALFSGIVAKQFSVFLVFLLKGFATTFGYPCATIMLTHSAKSIKVLATLNGVLTVAAAIARALAGAFGGSTFTFGLKQGYVSMPFFIMAFEALLGTIPVFLIVEQHHESEDTKKDSASSIEDDDTMVEDEDEEDEGEEETEGHTGRSREDGRKP